MERKRKKTGSEPTSPAKRSRYDDSENEAASSSDQVVQSPGRNQSADRIYNEAFHSSSHVSVTTGEDVPQGVIRNAATSIRVTATSSASVQPTPRGATIGGAHRPVQSLPLAARSEVGPVSGSTPRRQVPVEQHPGNTFETPPMPRIFDSYFSRGQFIGDSPLPRCRNFDQLEAWAQEDSQEARPVRRPNPTPTPRTRGNRPTRDPATPLTQASGSQVQLTQNQAFTTRSSVMGSVSSHSGYSGQPSGNRIQINQSQPLTPSSSVMGSGPAHSAYSGQPYQIQQQEQEVGRHSHQPLTTSFSEAGSGRSYNAYPGRSYQSQQPQEQEFGRKPHQMGNSNPKFGAPPSYMGRSTDGVVQRVFADQRRWLEEFRDTKPSTPEGSGPFEGFFRPRMMPYLPRDIPNLKCLKDYEISMHIELFSSKGEQMKRFRPDQREFRHGWETLTRWSFELWNRECVFLDAPYRQYDVPDLSDDHPDRMIYDKETGALRPNFPPQFGQATDRHPPITEGHRLEPELRKEQQPSSADGQEQGPELPADQQPPPTAAGYVVHPRDIPLASIEEEGQQHVDQGLEIQPVVGLSHDGGTSEGARLNQGPSIDQAATKHVDLVPLSGTPESPIPRFATPEPDVLAEAGRLLFPSPRRNTLDLDQGGHFGDSGVFIHNDGTNMSPSDASPASVNGSPANERIQRSRSHSSDSIAPSVPVKVDDGQSAQQPNSPAAPSPAGVKRNRQIQDDDRDSGELVEPSPKRARKVARPRSLEPSSPKARKGSTPSRQAVEVSTNGAALAACQSLPVTGLSKEDRPVRKSRRSKEELERIKASLPPDPIRQKMDARKKVPDLIEDGLTSALGGYKKQPRWMRWAAYEEQKPKTYISPNLKK